MRGDDRDFIVGTLSVLQEQRRKAMSAIDDMALRLDELEEFLHGFMEEQEFKDYDQAVEDAWISGRNFAEAEWQNDKIVYDSSRKKECMCDDCWGAIRPTDLYEHRMD